MSHWEYPVSDVGGVKSARHAGEIVPLTDPQNERRGRTRTRECRARIHCPKTVDGRGCRCESSIDRLRTLDWRASRKYAKSSRSALRYPYPKSRDSLDVASATCYLIILMGPHFHARDDLSHTLSIIYATETGNAQEYAGRIAHHCRTAHFRCRVFDVDKYPLVCD